jgi:hypothetical protein
MHPKTDPYKKKDVYQLTCQFCNKKYIGQTGSPFHTTYKEHERDYWYNSQKSNFAKQLVEEDQPIPHIDMYLQTPHVKQNGKVLHL